MLPFVPAAQAANPGGSDASILDPSGTTTEADPPVATILPAGTASHFFVLILIEGNQRDILYIEYCL